MNPNMRSEASVDPVPSTDALWAKIGQGEHGYHPLMAHMLDVAAVALTMWNRVIPAIVRDRIAAALELSPADAGLWIAFLAGLHDLGKASPAFQRQVLAAWRNVLSVGFIDPGPPTSPHRLRHDLITAATLPDLLRAIRSDLQPATASRLAAVVGGHHGLFHPAGQIRAANANDQSGRGNTWSRARASLVSALADLLRVPQIGPKGRVDNPTAMTLAGLTSVADWIGSSEAYFPYLVGQNASEQNHPKVSVDWSTYHAAGAASAAHALDDLGWSRAPGATPPISFGEMFPAFTPNHVQAQVASIAGEVSAPAMLIVEAPMGEGKTEAALYAVDRWMSAHALRGAYVALPTMATSNQMFGRVHRALASRFRDQAIDLQLLHGHASLSAEFQSLRRAADADFNPSRIMSGDEAGSVVASEWFTHRKRGLLSPFGVGTIDQTLLAVLQTKHVFVRLFGLAGKTIVFDEVHAYDTYMTSLLERLLEWLAALGSSVVLLSATLPRSRRNALLNAYGAGLGTAATDASPPPRYPRVTWMSADSRGAIPVNPSARTTRNVGLGWISRHAAESTSDQADRLIDLLRERLCDGGCAAIICNTVARAQETFSYLRDHAEFLAGSDKADGSPRLDLFHARYRFGERDTRESRCLRRFGHPDAVVAGTPVQRPRLAVVVATQVIEQSLDLDFDLIVSELAPVDLVLQRLGRRHRHERQRPVPVRSPEAWLLSPAMDNDIPAIERAQRHVYSEYVLLRTWLELRDLTTLRLPDDIEPLITRVYEEAADESLPESLRLRIKNALEHQETERADHRARAQANLIWPPHGTDSILDVLNKGLAEDEPEWHPDLQALTRLGEPTINVVLLERAQAALAALPDGPTLAEISTLLRHSVAITHQGIVHTIAEGHELLPPHPSWSKSPWLRNHRLALLDAGAVGEGRTHVGPYTLELHPELGVLIHRSEGG